MRLRLKYAWKILFDKKFRWLLVMIIRYAIQTGGVEKCNASDVIWFHALYPDIDKLNNRV